MTGGAANGYADAENRRKDGVLDVINGLEGDEAFLALTTLHRNGRWHMLFPHDSRDAP